MFLVFVYVLKYVHTGHMSSNEFRAKDIMKKISCNILRTCPGHVQCPQMCLKFQKGQTRPFLTLASSRENNLNRIELKL